MRRNALATGFLAVDFAVVGPLIRTSAMDWYANLLVACLTTGYLMAVYLVIVQPEETADDPSGSSRTGPPD